jgi:hypothetical protein
MAVFSTTVFAAPLSLAGSLDTTSSEFSLAGQTSAPYDGLDALFADVNATALTDTRRISYDAVFGLSSTASLKKIYNRLV